MCAYKEDTGMLKEFRVKNFKGFSKELVLDLSADNYEFAVEATKNNIVNQGLIYGHNGSGKSNLGLAIFDIVLNLTDKEKMLDRYNVYLNGDSNEKEASFQYTFYFLGKEVEYSYRKTNPQNFNHEKLIINNTIMLDYDFVKDEGVSNFIGTENLKIKSQDRKLSKLKFIKNNAILEDNENNTIFNVFMDYVDKMLLFYSLDQNRYQGLLLGSDQLDNAIIKSGNLKDFERFLKRNDVNETLVENEINGQKIIFFKYKNALYPFNDVASNGTKSLELFYYWYKQIEKASFVFIDEFDAFYHYEVSENIVKSMLNIPSVQCLMTTHNTDLLNNDLLRPDCYYNLENGNIKSLAKSTEKEIRRIHNIQKMFKAGAFNEK